MLIRPYPSFASSLRYTLWLLLCIFFWTPGVCWSQALQQNPLIHSFQIKGINTPLELPLLTFNPEQELHISFDLLENTPRALYYRVTHCSPNLTPSPLSDLEYLDGFNNPMMADPEFSFNTLIPYYHYQLSLPNNNIRLITSGKYSIEIIDPAEEDLILATAYFTLSEEVVQVNTELSTNTLLGNNSEYQELSLNLNWRPEVNILPSELSVVITQNNRPETERILDQPSTISTHNAKYHLQPKLIFEAGNHFRRFETTDLQYPGMGIECIMTHQDTYHVILKKDQTRNHTPFLYDQDQNGRFLIKSLRSEHPEIESEYVWTHFRLNKPLPFLEEDVYIEGNFLPLKQPQNNKLKYDAELGAYTGTFLLKQGHYNYRYITVNRHNQKTSPSLIEGNHFETENEYLIEVYYHKPGERHSRLLGYQVIQNQ